MAMEDRRGISRESTHDAGKAFAVFTAVMVLVMIFPIHGFANKVEPMVLGMLFSLFWISVWAGIIASILGLMAIVALFVGVSMVTTPTGSRAEEYIKA